MTRGRVLRLEAGQALGVAGGVAGKRRGRGSLAASGDAPALAASRRLLARASGYGSGGGGARAGERRAPASLHPLGRGLGQVRAVRGSPGRERGRSTGSPVALSFGG